MQLILSDSAVKIKVHRKRNVVERSLTEQRAYISSHSPTEMLYAAIKEAARASDASAFLLSAALFLCRRRAAVGIEHIAPAVSRHTFPVSTHSSLIAAFHAHLLSSKRIARIYIHVTLYTYASCVLNFFPISRMALVESAPIFRQLLSQCVYGII